MSDSRSVAGLARDCFVLYFVKGLADVVLAELHELLPEATVVACEERFAVVELPASRVERLHERMRTVDDIRTVLTAPTVFTSETEFAAACQGAAARAEQLLADSRSRVEMWSVTLCSRNPPWRGPTKWDPGVAIAAAFRGADVAGRTRSAVDLRVQVDGECMHVSLNLWDRPIGKRDEDLPARLGALRPSVAASLVRLATGGTDERTQRLGVYDPFCGTGTIVAEAAWLRLPVFASDVDKHAVELTRARIAGLADGRPKPTDESLIHRVFVHDVHRGFPKRVSARIVVSNLPWGKQVKVPRRHELFEATSRLAAFVVEEGGSCVFLTTHEGQLLARLNRRVKAAKVSSLSLGLLGQTPAAVCIRAE